MKENSPSYSIVKQVQVEQEEKEPLNGVSSSRKSVSWATSNSSSDGSDDLRSTAVKLYQLRRNNIILSIALSIATFLLLTCLTLLYLHPYSSTGASVSSTVDQDPRANSGPNPTTYGRGCGSSIAQAKAFNCRFDILSKAWLPQECTDLGNDEYLTDSWSWNHTGWGIYADRWQTRELTLEELSQYADSGLKWYGTEREHLVHCAWGLKRVLDAFWHGKKLDFVIQQLHHTTHCVDRLYMSAIKADGLDIVLGKGNVRFGHC
ncbi:hypothetical protein QBC37DRAFT_377883 [Rhypophila decipiens]|uniref:Uncharacterized protein n=1 Tax=Rhypophila decipiens TaxID=261697 RepID=A0AAN6Y1P6_9PEZI|nr:hypothetical protein QBC37DRAFT_377883 [Rhypophila decipiens]